MASLAFDTTEDMQKVLKKKPKEGAELLSKVSNIKITPKDIKKGAPSAFKTMGKLEQKAEMGEEPSAEDLNDLKDAPEIEKKEEKPWSEDSKKKVFMALSASLPIIIGGAFGGAEGASFGAKTGAGILGDIGKKEEEAAKNERERLEKLELARVKGEEDAKMKAEQRTWLEGQNALQRASIEGERTLKRAEKEDEKNEKRKEKELQLAVPGYERTGEVLPKPEEAAKLRVAVANAEQLTNKLSRLKDLVTKYGSYEYGGEGGQEMETLATEIQLLSKNPEMYNLGVLTGPDLSLLNKITADPTSTSSMFTRDSTRQKQIQTQLNSILGKLSAVTKASGYKPAQKSTFTNGGVFPRQVRKGDKVATVENEQELQEATAEGWR